MVYNKQLILSKTAIFSVLAVLLLTVASSCTSDKKSTESSDSEGSMSKVSLRQEWFPYAGYAGEVTAANETDSLYGIDLTVEAGADNIDPIKLVTSGSNDFGVVSAD